MLGCAGLSLQLLASVDLANAMGKFPLPVPIDSYCQVYNPVIITKGDAQISARLAVKKRILANELTYRQECKK